MYNQTKSCKGSSYGLKHNNILYMQNARDLHIQYSFTKVMSTDADSLIVYLQTNITQMCCQRVFYRKKHS